MDTALYYPHVPSAKWLRIAALCWDRVVHLTGEFGELPNLPEDVTLLSEACGGLLEPFTANRFEGRSLYIEAIRRGTEEFLTPPYSPTLYREPFEDWLDDRMSKLRDNFSRYVCEAANSVASDVNSEIGRAHV